MYDLSRCLDCGISARCLSCARGGMHPTNNIRGCVYTASSFFSPDKEWNCANYIDAGPLGFNPYQE